MKTEGTATPTLGAPRAVARRRRLVVSLLLCAHSHARTHPRPPSLPLSLPPRSVTIQLDLPKCKSTVAMETVQCAVLSVFRKTTRAVVAYAEMRDTLSIEPELLQRVLLTLLSKPNNHCSGGLLLKAPKGKVSFLLPLHFTRILLTV